MKSSISRDGPRAICSVMQFISIFKSFCTASKNKPSVGLFSKWSRFQKMLGGSSLVQNLDLGSSKCSGTQPQQKYLKAKCLLKKSHQPLHSSSFKNKTGSNEGSTARKYTRFMEACHNGVLQVELSPLGILHRTLNTHAFILFFAQLSKTCPDAVNLTRTMVPSSHSGGNSGHCLS